MRANEDGRLSARLFAGLLSGIVVAGLTACGGGGGGGGAGVVDPKNSDAMMQALGVKLGESDATREDEEELPAPSSETESPKVTNVPGNNSVSPGEEKAVSVETEQTSPLTTLYAKVTGASSRFRAPVASTSALRKQAGTGTLSLSFAIPSNLGAGEFCVELAVEDEEGRVSEASTTCFRYTPEGKEPAAVRSALQGVWERCDDGFGERFSFDGTTLTVEEGNFDNSSCNGTPTDTFTETLDIAIGQPFIADSGETVNPVDATVTESDDSQAVGQTFLDIVFVEGSEEAFRLGVETAPETRPTAIDFQTPAFRRPTDNTPLEEQSWSFSVNGTVTENGESQNISFDSQEPVSGLNVPQQQPDESDVVLSEGFSAGFQGSCDSFQGQSEVRELNYTRTGGGGVGTDVELIIDYFADGTCTQNGETQQIDIDVRLTYNWTRVE